MPVALAIGPAGNLYVAGSFGAKCHPAIEIFARGAYGNVAPIAIIKGPKAALHSPQGIAFDQKGQLYVAQGRGGASGSGEIKVFAAGARGDAAPIATIAGPNTLFGNSGDAPEHVAVDAESEIFAGQVVPSGNQILKFAAGASGNVAPITTTFVQSGNGFFEMQVAGDTVYAAVGLVRKQTPTVYELSTVDLSQTGALVDNRFTILHADADSSGRVFVQDLSSRSGSGFKATFFEYEPGRQEPSQIRRDGTMDGGSGYVVVGP